MTMVLRPKKGFASLSPEERREMGSRGGKAAHEVGTAHRFTPEEAREAGKKGGLALHVSRGPHKRHTFLPDEGSSSSR